MDKETSKNYVKMGDGDREMGRYHQKATFHNKYIRVMSVLPVWIRPWIPAWIRPQQNALADTSLGRAIPRWNRLGKRI